MAGRDSGALVSQMNEIESIKEGTTVIENNSFFLLPSSCLS